MTRSRLFWFWLALPEWVRMTVAALAGLSLAAVIVYASTL